jgi:hypothetical protein
VRDRAHAVSVSHGRPSPSATLSRRGPLGTADRWLLGPAPAARLGAFRALVGAYSAVWGAVRLPAHAGLADHDPSRWAPIGVLAPASSPLPDVVVVGAAWALPLLGLAVALGWRHRLTGPLWAAVLLLVTTLASSWGQIFHTENLLALHALVLAVVPAADAWSLDARRRAEAGEPEPRASGRYGWPVRVAAIVTVLAYLLAGIAKLRVSGLGWAGGDVLRNLVAHDNLRKAVLGDVHSPLGSAAVQHGWLFPPMAAASLAVELAAPLALLGGRIRTAWVASAWVFHVGVLALMAILFPYQLVPVAFAPLFRLERAVPWFRTRLSRRGARQGTRSSPPVDRGATITR